MVVAYLLSAVIVAVICTSLWLITGGSVVMALFVYAMSGLLMIAALASANFIRTRAREH